MKEKDLEEQRRINKTKYFREYRARNRERLNLYQREYYHKCLKSMKTKKIKEPVIEDIISVKVINRRILEDEVEKIDIEILNVPLMQNFEDLVSRRNALLIRIEQIDVTYLNVYQPDITILI